METGFMNRIIGLVLALVVGGLLVGGLLIPSIEAMTATEKTFENEGYFYIEKINADDDRAIVLSWTADSPKQFTIDGTAVDVSAWPNSGYTIVTDGESKIVRMGTSTAVAFQTMGSSFNSGGSGIKTSTLTISQGTMTVVTVNSSDVTTTLTASYTDLWVYSTTPTDWIMKKADKIAYLHEDSEYLAMGVTLVTQWNTIIKVTGTVDDFDADIVFPSGVTTTTTNKDIVIEENSSYNDLYELDKLTFTVSDGTSTVDATYSYFIVPASITAEKSWHLDTTEIAMFGVISILGIIMLVVIAANAIRTKY